MALSETNIRYCFEMLECPYATNYHTLSEVGSLSFTSTVGDTGSQAKTAILAAIAAFDIDTETTVAGLCTEWLAVRTDTDKITTGGVENAAGFQYDPELARRRLQKLLKDNYLPFFRYHEILAKRNGQSSSIAINRI